MKTRYPYTTAWLIGLLCLWQAPRLPAQNLAGLNDGLVAYYPLDGDVLDASGNGHNGVNTGVSFQPAHSGQGAFFDGDSGHHVRVDDFPEIRSNLTVTAWFRPQNLFSGLPGSPLVTRGCCSQEAYTMFVDYE